MTPAGLLCVFCKAPVPGRVKTRLIPELGAERAALLAAAGLRDTWALVTRHGRARLVLDGSAQDLPNLSPQPQIVQQASGDLGDRLSACFRSVLTDAPWVMALGTDSPGLPGAELKAATAWLEGGGGGEPRAVLGPSRDGGYYLIGVSAWQEGLLDGLPWSQPSTRLATRERLLASGYALRETGEYFDVDDAGDYRLLVDAAQRPGFHAPATSALLRAWSRG